MSGVPDTAGITAEIEAALAELRRLRCADPAARRAVDAVRLTAHTLQYFWLPTLARQPEPT